MLAENERGSANVTQSQIPKTNVATNSKKNEKDEDKSAKNSENDNATSRGSRVEYFLDL